MKRQIRGSSPISVLVLTCAALLAASTLAQQISLRPSPEQAAGRIEPPSSATRCDARRFGEEDHPRGEADRFAGDEVRFGVRFGDEVNRHRLMSFTAMPGEEVLLEAVFEGGVDRFNACAEGGTLTPEGESAWSWRAPERPGLYRLAIADETAGETMLLKAFVLVPYGGQDVFHGFRVGRYERLPLRQNPVYERPAGLIRLEPDLLDTWVSPHFQLRQFVCKQQSSWPKYMLLHARLLLKLEALLGEVNERGFETPTFAVLSGYRTPHYNAAIGNPTRYSRHLYGDAADIYIDRDGDGRMDDLNGDGRIDTGDARLLAAVVEGNIREPWYRPFVGGLGIYGPKPHRGPFIHVDTRGFPARW